MEQVDDVIEVSLVRTFNQFHVGRMVLVGFTIEEIEFIYNAMPDPVDGMQESAIEKLGKAMLAIREASGG